VPRNEIAVARMHAIVNSWHICVIDTRGRFAPVRGWSQKLRRASRDVESSTRRDETLLNCKSAPWSPWGWLRLPGTLKSARESGVRRVESDVRRLREELRG
jgi:hypothetical protein